MNPKVYRKYKKAPKNKKENKPKERKTYQPLIVTKRSKKFITFTACNFELVVSQDQRAKIKEFFILWVEGTISSKIAPSLSLQIVQNKHKGAVIQTFFKNILDEGPFQPAKVSFMEQGRTQLIPKMVKQ